MNKEIWNERSLSDLLTLEFLVTATGNIITASIIVMLAFIVSAWVASRIRRVADR